MYALLADLVLLLHVGFVLFVVAGLFLIVLGALRGWNWIRQFHFRLAHLLCIGLVAGESWVGAVCPLTQWENRLRDLAGQRGYGDRSFVGYWLGKLLYWDLPPWGFVLIYSLFGLAVLGVFVWVPPQLNGTSKMDKPRSNQHNGLS
ncbi:MAG: DUF2784 domain-containing protein [Phycisphaeraceae bacterium]|nr:DUF2784 domain-containing protein [Phycisphaeraceae bacterium]